MSEEAGVVPSAALRAAGLLLTPGAGADRDHATLVAIEQAVGAVGVGAGSAGGVGAGSAGGVADSSPGLSHFVVLRHDFAYQRNRKTKRVPPPPSVEKVVDELMAEFNGLAASVGVAPERMVLGGRSFGGRVCSMAVARGLPAAGLVLLSYPLHPPQKPDRLRIEHFGDITVPCLFVSGDNDRFGAPREFARYLPTLGTDQVRSLFVAGGGHNPSNSMQLGQITTAVTSWLGDLRL